MHWSASANATTPIGRLAFPGTATRTARSGCATKGKCGSTGKIACATKAKAKEPAGRRRYENQRDHFEMNADVHGITCAVGFQFSGGGFVTRGIGGEVCGARDGGDGVAGPRRGLWRAAILSGGEENFGAGAYWGGGDVGGGVEVSSAGGNAGRIPEPLPVDYAHEIAGAQGRRAGVGRRGGRKSRGADLPDGREGRAAGARARAGRRGKWIGVRAEALRNFRAQKCVCGIAAAF